MSTINQRDLVGTIVRIFMDDRHDFVRKGQVLDISGDDLLVRWVDYDLPDEWIPARWL